jgi:hypothetical protein
VRARVGATILDQVPTGEQQHLITAENQCKNAEEYRYLK